MFTHGSLSINHVLHFLTLDSGRAARPSIQFISAAQLLKVPGVLYQPSALPTAVVLEILPELELAQAKQVNQLHFALPDTVAPRGCVQISMASSASSSSEENLGTAVAQLARAAAGAALSARTGTTGSGIPQAIETEVADDLTAKSNLLARPIQASIGIENIIEEPTNANVDKAVSTIGKRRKLSSKHAAANELVGDSALSKLKSRQIACDECAFRCASVSDLTAHKRTHSGERPFACDRCEYRFAQKSSLTRHKRVHSGERPYACNECAYRGAQRGDLIVHKRIHSGERPYACSECKYRSASSGDLIMHKRVHSGERPFACDECGYRCARKDHLTVHKRIHSGERPFACDQCDFRCAQRGSLNVHKRIHSRSGEH